MQRKIRGLVQRFPKKKKSKKTNKNVLAEVMKEMARPRIAESARKEEEEAIHRLTKHDSFMIV